MGSLTDFKKRHGIPVYEKEEANASSGTEKPNSLTNFLKRHGAIDYQERARQKQKDMVGGINAQSAPFLKTPQTASEHSFATVGKAFADASWAQQKAAHDQRLALIAEGQKAREEAEGLTVQIQEAKKQAEKDRQSFYGPATTYGGQGQVTPQKEPAHLGQRAPEIYQGSEAYKTVEELEARQRELKLKYWSSLFLDPEFEGKSAYVPGSGNLDYQLVNRVPSAVNAQGEFDQKLRAVGLDKDYYGQLKDDEVALYNYLFSTQGADSAKEFLEAMRPTLYARQRTEMEDTMRVGAEEAPVASSILSVAMSPMKGIGYLGQTADYLADGTIDQNAPWNRYSHASSTIRDTVGSSMGDVGNFFYQTGMSLGDFAASLAVGGQTGSLALMGTAAASDTVIEAKDRGLDDDQAYALGTLAGAAEVVMEKIGIDALFDTKLLRNKGAWGYIIKNALAEGGEEVGTDVINTLADIIISKDKSYWQMAIDAYREDGKTEGQAFGLAVWDKVKETFGSFVGGALSGGLLSSVGAVASKSQITEMGRQLDAMELSSQQIRQIIRQELDIPGLPVESRAYQLALKMLDTLNAGKQVSGSQIAQMLVAGQEYLDAQAGDAELPEGDSQNEGGVAVPPSAEGDTPTVNYADRPLVEGAGGVGDPTQTEGQMDPASVGDTPTVNNADSPLREGAEGTVETGGDRHVADAPREDTVLGDRGVDDIAHEDGVSGRDLGDRAEVSNDDGPAWVSLPVVEQEGAYDGEGTGPQFAESGRGAGAGVSDGGSQWDAGSGAGEQTGRMGSGPEGRRAQAFRSRKAAVDRQNRFKNLQIPKVSSRELGIESGTDAQITREVTDEYWDDEMQDLAVRIYEETGKEVRYVLGTIQIRGADGRERAVRGVYTGDQIFVQADHYRISMEQVADHEAYHAKADDDILLNQEIRQYIIDTFSEEELQAVLDRYIDALYGVYDLTGDMDGEALEEAMKLIEEEVFADAYAGINDFGAGVFTDAVNERMDQLNKGKLRAQDNGTAEPTGPPVERFSIGEINGVNERYGLGVILDTDIFDGVKPSRWGRVLGEYVYNHLAGTEMTVYDENGREEVIHLAETTDRVRKDGAKNSHKVIDKLARYHGDNISALATVHLSELLKTSRYEKSTDEHNHQWMDENGWEYRKTYIQDVNGNIYEATLNIANGRDRRILYTINNIRKIDKQRAAGGVVPSTHSGRGSLTNSNSSGRRVSDKTGIVKPKFSFAGEQAQTADLDALERAKEMQAAGVADETIRQETGWFVGMDGKWRWEIEARDHASRRTLTSEGRKAKAPDLGDPGTTVFVEDGDGRSKRLSYSVDDTSNDLNGLRLKDLEDVPEYRPGMNVKADGGDRPKSTHIPEGYDSVDQFVADAEGRAARIKAELLRNIPKEEFRGTDALDRLGVKVDNSVGLYRMVKQLIANDRAEKEIRREIKKAEKRLGATAAEKNFASGMAAGVFFQEDIPRSMDVHTVLELADYYWAEKALTTDMIRQQRTEINKTLTQKIQQIMRKVDTSKIKLPKAFQLNHRTATRNMITIFGDQIGKELNEFLFEPVAVNEAERIRFVNRMHDQVRVFEDSQGKRTKLNKAERALVQQLIEGRAVEETVAGMEMKVAIQNAAHNIRNGQDAGDAAREHALSAEERKLAVDYSRWLQTKEMLESDTVDAVKINNAAEKYAELFDQFYEAINDFLVAHGYEPIGFIKGYTPHLQPESNQTMLNKALQSLGVSMDVATLPTSIAGLTKNFKPNKRWNPFFLTRNSDVTQFDIAKAFESYVDYMSDVFFHTDDIMRVRQTSNYFRKTFAPDEIREHIEQAQELRFGKTEEKVAFLRENGEISRDTILSEKDIDQAMDEYVDTLFTNLGDRSTYSDFVMWLDDYANKLAEKQLMADRDMERTLGRNSLNLVGRISRAFARAQVSMNFSSALNQTAQMPMILGENGVINTMAAAKDIVSGKIKKAAWFQESDVLTEKKGVKYIVSTPGEMLVSGTFKPLEYMDGFMSALAVRGRYLKEVKAGKSHNEAMKVADSFARSIMGSRAKGSIPLAFQSKGIVAQFFHLFQVEAANSWEHLVVDLPHDFRDIQQTAGTKAAAGALAGVIIKMLLAAFFLNRMDEELYGGTPAPYDLFGLTANFIASGNGLTTNEYLKRLIDECWEAATGERLFDTDPDETVNEEFDWSAALSDSWYNVSNDIPYLRNAFALLGWGDETLPIPDVWGTVQDVYSAATDEDAGVFSYDMLQALLGIVGDTLPAGRQMEKTVAGIETATRGGKYKGVGEDAKLQYPVDVDPWTALRLALFGDAAAPERNEYYASDFSALTSKQTQVYEALVDSGADEREVYDAIQAYRQVNNDKSLSSLERGRKCRNIISSMELSDEQKLDMYLGMTGAESTAEKFRIMMGTGLNWDQIMDTYDMYSELKTRDDLNATGQATEFSNWVDKRGYTTRQATTIKEELKFWNMVPAQATQYEKITYSGLNEDVAYGLNQALSEIKPEAGEDKVSNVQRWRACVEYFYDTDDQMTALFAVMEPRQYQKVEVAYDFGVDPDAYVSLQEILPDYDADGNGDYKQSEVQNAIEALGGQYSTQQKAVLWQLVTGSKSSKKNPYSQAVGQQVIDARDAKKSQSDGDEGSFSDAVMGQLMG